MRRRTLLVGIATTLVAAGCSRTDSLTPSQVTQTAIPPGTTPVVSWRLVGGSTPAAVLALRPPRLVVYPGGEVIADATYRSDLTSEDVAGLIAKLSDDLRDPAAAQRRDGVTPASGAPTTVLAVRSRDDERTAEAAALDELRDEDGYPEEIYDARDRVAEMHEQVVSSGQPYTANRVRLVAEASRTSQPEVQMWPESVSVPACDGPGGIGTVDAEGQHARDIVRLLARDLDLNGAWPAYRAPDGRVLCAAWRYLLPDE